MVGRTESGLDLVQAPSMSSFAALRPHLDMTTVEEQDCSVIPTMNQALLRTYLQNS